MGSGTSTPNYGTQPTAATSPTSVANAFLGNRALSSGASVPTSNGSAFSQLAATGSLPGLTGSLIGNGSMPALPKPSGPMPIPVPAAATASGAGRAIDPHQRWGSFNVRSDGSTKLTPEQEKQKKLMGGPLYAGGR